MVGYDTVKRIVRAHVPVDPLGTWTLGDIDPDDARDARYVLRVLAAVSEYSDYTISVGRSLVPWIIRIHKAAPDMRPLNVYHHARAYLRAAPLGQTRPLDLELAFGQWRRGDALRYEDVPSRLRTSEPFDRAEPEPDPGPIHPVRSVRQLRFTRPRG